VYNLGVANSRIDNRKIRNLSGRGWNNKRNNNNNINNNNESFDEEDYLKWKDDYDSKKIWKKNKK
jgi:uncharacterized protein YijF (DUF1287 family)